MVASFWSGGIEDSHHSAARSKARGSHTPTEDRQARLSGEGSGYLHAVREYPYSLFSTMLRFAQTDTPFGVICCEALAIFPILCYTNLEGRW